jgi:hypothetical protein
MRIFYAVHHHNWEDLNMYPALVEMGHEVIRYDWGYSFLATKQPSYTGQVRAEVSERMLTTIKEEHRRKPIDLFYSYLLTRIIVPDIVDEIRRLGIVTVNFHCNNVHQFHLVEEIAPRFDFCSVPERQTLVKYKAVGARPLYVPMAANPHRYKPYNVRQLFDATFVGARYLTRGDFLKALLTNDIDVKIFGEGWVQPTPWRRFRRRFSCLGEESKGLFGVVRGLLSAVRPLASGIRQRQRRRSLAPSDDKLFAANVREPVSDSKYVELFSRSAISLGFTAVDKLDPNGQPLRHVRLREYEAPMSRALYFVEYCEELEEFYVPDKEVVVFRTPGELVDKARYYLKNTRDAEKVRDAGYQRARREHTWAHRFRKLFELVGLTR